MEFLTDINVISAFLTLIILEIILGFDNIIFLTLMVNQLPREKQNIGRKLGLLGAMVTRLLLLFSISWMTKLTTPLFFLSWFGNHPVSGRDLILFFGGLFLIYKAVQEINQMLDNIEEEASLPKKVATSLFSIIMQIALIDIVFSFDSVITAVGLADQYFVMAAAIIVAIIVMLFTAEAIGTFIEKHPSIKMLALSFLVMVGAILIADSAGHHIPKGYLYFSIAFAISVEMLNLKIRGKSTTKHAAN